MSVIYQNVMYTNEYRPCIFSEAGYFLKQALSKNALFHGWQTDRNGEIRGIIEFEDGDIITCNPAYIRFCDNIFKKYHWPDKE